MQPENKRTLGQLNLQPSSQKETAITEQDLRDIGVSEPNLEATLAYIEKLQSLDPQTSTAPEIVNLTDENGETVPSIKINRPEDSPPVYVPIPVEEEADLSSTSFSFTAHLEGVTILDQQNIEEFNISTGLHKELIREIAPVVREEQLAFNKDALEKGEEPSQVSALLVLVGSEHQVHMVARDPENSDKLEILRKFSVRDIEKKAGLEQRDVVTIQDHTFLKEDLEAAREERDKVVRSLEDLYKGSGTMFAVSASETIYQSDKDVDTPPHFKIFIKTEDGTEFTRITIPGAAARRDED